MMNGHIKLTSRPPPESFCGLITPQDATDGMLPYETPRRHMIAGLNEVAAASFNQVVFLNFFFSNPS